METKKFENLEIKLEERYIHSRSSDTDTSTGGVGVNLRATITDEKGISHPLFERQVRGTGRDGDDFRHWYRNIECVERKDGEVYVTLNSGLLRDTYAFNPNKRVRLAESVDLEELQKQEKMREILGNLEGKPLDEVASQFGKIVAEKYTSSGTAVRALETARVLEIAVDEEQRVGIVVLERCNGSYDPAISAIELYAVTPEGSFKKLEGVHLGRYLNPKNSTTFFNVRDLKLSEKKVELTGEVVLRCWTDWGETDRTLDRITKEMSIGKEYRKFREVL